MRSRIGRGRTGQTRTSTAAGHGFLPFVCSFFAPQGEKRTHHKHIGFTQTHGFITPCSSFFRPAGRKKELQKKTSTMLPQALRTLRKYEQLCSAKDVY